MLEHSDRGMDWTNGHDYPTLRGYTVVDGVAYSQERIRELIRERHTLAEENTLLRGRGPLIERMDEIRLRTIELRKHADEVAAEAERVAEENTRLRLEADTLREKLRPNACHLAHRTSALTRLVARKGPVL